MGTMLRILTMILCLAYSLAGAAQDVYIGMSKDGIREFYIYSITKMPTYIEVVEKIKPSPGKLTTFRNQEIETRDKCQLSLEGYKLYAYRMVKCRIDCKTKKYRMIEWADYDEKNQPIYIPGPLESITAWEKIEPRSIRETEFHIVCDSLK